MQAAWPSESDARETQELLRLFHEAKAAGMVVQVGPSESPHSCDPCCDEALCEDTSPATLIPAETVVNHRRRCLLTAEKALRLFQARAQRKGKRGGLADELAQEEGVSSRTVRDIWNLRTWTEVTRPQWSPADYKRFAATRRAGQKPPPQCSAKPYTAEECFDLLPRVLDPEWKLHAAWLAAPHEDLDMSEFDGLFAGHHRPYAAVRA